MIIYSVFFALGKVRGYTLYIVAAGLLVSIPVTVALSIRKSREYFEKMKDEFAGFDMLLAFTADYIENTRVSGGVRRHNYDSVGSALITPHYIALFLAGNVLPIERGRLTIGDEPDLIAFLKKKGVKIK